MQPPEMLKMPTPECRWVLVPAELTPEMIAAGRSADGGADSVSLMWQAMWAAMLAAAPMPPQPLCVPPEPDRDRA